MTRSFASIAVLGLLPACSAEIGGGDETTAGTLTSVGEGASEGGSTSEVDGTGSNSAEGSASSAGSASASGGSSEGPQDESGSADTSAGEDSTGGVFDLDELDDDFEGGALAGWDTFAPQASSVALESGQLVLEPGANTVWLNDSVSVLLWKEVPGNFIATASVVARRADNPDEVPWAGYRFGGLMARNASEANGQNYVFIVLGTDTDASVETKTTTNSSSVYDGPPWPSAAGEIRICRVGSTFRMLVREPGGAWQLSQQFERGDLPDPLQVGPIAYNNDALPDLRVTFDFVDFESIDMLDECTS